MSASTFDIVAMDLGQYTVPGVEWLYLVGPFMHPGGGVFGAGHATAIRMFEDLGMDFEGTAGGSVAPAAAAPTAAPQVGAVVRPGVRLRGPAAEEIMAVSSFEREGDSLLIKGKTLGTMPLVARLDPQEARAGLKMLGLRLLFFLLSLLFRRSTETEGP